MEKLSPEGKKFLVVSEFGNDTLREVLDAECQSKGLYDIVGRLSDADVKEYGAVVLMGDGPVVALGASMGIDVLRNNSWFIEGIPAIPTYSILSVKYDKAKLLPIAKDLFKARTIVAGELSWDRSWNTTKISCYDGDLSDLCELARHTKRLAFDVETTGLSFINDTITVLSLTAQAGSSLVVPFNHKDALIGPGELEQLKELMADPTIVKVAHNAKFDLSFLRRAGVEVRGQVLDTLLMHHILFNHKPNGLKDIAAEYFPAISGYETDLAKYNNQWDSIPLPELATYAGIDTDVTWRISVAFEDMLLNDMPSYLTYHNVMGAAIKPLFNTEYRGCRINTQLLAEATEKATVMKEEYLAKIMSYPQVHLWEKAAFEAAKKKRIDECTAKIESSKQERARKGWVDKLNDAMAGNIESKKFNPDSPIQLKQLLYWKGWGFEFPVPRDDRGTPIESTDKNVLGDLDDTSGFIDAILIYRGISKTLSTYLTSILEKTDSSGYLHGRFNQAGTATFRMSSSDPNLQNVISRSRYEDVMNIVAYVKKSFIPDPDEVLLQVDFSQLELRLMAHMANEPVMINAYKEDKDLHVLGACDSMHISEDDFHALEKAEQKSARQKAKARNFGLIYKVSVKGYKSYAKTSYGVILSDEEAQAEHSGFFRLYPKILLYHMDVEDEVKRNGFMRTLFGSRIQIPDIYSFVKERSSAAVRNAINGPVQGTGGLLTEFCIALLALRLHPSVKIINSVHDSIIFSMPKHLLADTVEVVRDTMENAPVKKFFGFEFNLPIKVDFEASNVSWKEVMPLDEYLNSVKEVAD